MTYSTKQATSISIVYECIRVKHITTFYFLNKILWVMYGLDLITTLEHLPAQQNTEERQKHKV